MSKTHDGLYSIEIQDVISRCFKNLCLQWILTKYGNEARKVMSLLQDDKYYETSYIAKKCLIDEKDAKGVIYRQFS